MQHSLHWSCLFQFCYRSSYCFAMTVIVATTCTAWSLQYPNLLRDRGAVTCVWLFSTASDPRRRQQLFFNYYYYFTLLVLLSIVTSMLLNYVLLSVNWYFVSLEINQCHVVSFTFVLLSFSSDTVSLKKLFPAFQFITRWWNSGKELTKPNADTFGFLPCQVTTEFWICFIQC